MSLRAVRSPLAPKMTMEQGSTAFRSASNRQAMSSSRCSGVFTSATLAEAEENFNVHIGCVTSDACRVTRFPVTCHPSLVTRHASRFTHHALTHRKTVFASLRRHIYFTRTVADVAELADALDSKSSTRESVWVRPPPSAPYESPP